MSSSTSKPKVFRIYGDSSISRRECQWICEILNDRRSWTYQLYQKGRIPFVKFVLTESLSDADWHVAMKTNAQIRRSQPEFDGLSMT